VSGLSKLSTDASYRTLLTLATGGMGRVDLAMRREGNFERLFAIKRPRPELASEDEVRAMFLDETRIAGLIRHPNVVSIVDVGEDRDGPFAVMELVDGISVATLLAKPEVHPLPLEIALRIALSVAEGLHAAHELVGSDGTRLQLVHRDVSPQNILLGFDGVARVTDFGVAKAMGRVSKTSTGILKGKLGYISPEQLRFEEPDRRADLFALGVVLFELLTGQRLYRSQEGTEGARRILSEPPPDLADFRDDVEPELVALMFELLAKAREARPQTAKLVARRLEAILANVTAGVETVETADFLREHFGSERAELEGRIAAARLGMSASVAASNGRAGQRRRIGLWSALGAGSVLALAAALLQAARSDGRDRALQRESATTASAPAPRPVAVTTAESAGSSAEQAAADAKSTAEPAAERAAPSTRNRAVRPAPARKSPKATTSKSGVPIWESY
jgi:serine/threonine-protein kinase